MIRAKENTTLKILDTNDYYPFGMNFLASALVGESVFNPQTSPLNYKYNGKELQETGMYMFKYRTFMPDTCRFIQLDPLAEKFPYNSTYAFQEIKMGMGVELEGLELLKNITGYFAINGNQMTVKQAPITQRDSFGRPSFRAGDIGLSTSGYNPNRKMRIRIRITCFSTQSEKEKCLKEGTFCHLKRILFFFKINSKKSEIKNRLEKIVSRRLLFLCS
ncbi:MAG: hypothetical protein JST62_09770 [Bacteroidetes bacterium]|nr:hypothetical protein [Bacteroidota bacterium]